jgi:hypothetical protein
LSDYKTKGATGRPASSREARYPTRQHIHKSRNRFTSALSISPSSSAIMSRKEGGSRIGRLRLKLVPHQIAKPQLGIENRD